MELAGKVALVTGGGTGLGRTISVMLARHGAAVAVGYSQSAADAEQTVEEIAGAGGRAVALQADLADWASAEALVGGVGHALGPIDILVNNAGITRYIPFPNVHDVTP